MSSVALGQFGGQGKGKGQGPGGGRGKGGPGGQGPGGGFRMDPAQMAARMIQQFDKDGDKALNQQELAAAMKAMMERRMQGGQGKGKGNPGGQGKGKGKGNFGGGNPGGNAGGRKPKRPARKNSLSSLAVLMTRAALCAGAAGKADTENGGPVLSFDSAGPASWGACRPGAVGAGICLKGPPNST